MWIPCFQLDSCSRTLFWVTPDMLQSKGCSLIPWIKRPESPELWAPEIGFYSQKHQPLSIFAYLCILAYSLHVFLALWDFLHCVRSPALHWRARCPVPGRWAFHDGGGGASQAASSPRCSAQVPWGIFSQGKLCTPSKSILVESQWSYNKDHVSLAWTMKTSLM